MLADRYGTDTKQSPRTQLRAGIIGVAGDAAHDELVVVVDPTKVSIAELETALTEDRDESKRPAPVVVRSGCRNADDLMRAYDLLIGRAWHPDAKRVSFGFSLDAYASQWTVGINPGPAADSLREQLGDLARVTDAPDAGRN